MTQQQSLDRFFPAKQPDMAASTQAVVAQESTHDVQANLDLLDAQTQESVRALVQDYPASTPVIHALLQLLREAKEARKEGARPVPPSNESPQAKRAKLDSKQSPSTLSKYAPLVLVPDVSFQMPRKKLSLALGQDRFWLMADDGKEESSPIRSVAYANVVKILCLPTPNKPKKHYTYVLVMAASSPSSSSSLSKGDMVDESDDAHIVFTVPEDRKPALMVRLVQETSERAKRIVQTTTGATTNRLFMHALLKECMPASLILEPSISEFRSMVPQSTSGGISTSGKDPVFHVNAYWKAKEGHLYLLRGGIFYGFKKPMLFFPFSSILKMDIHSITSRTFDITIQYRALSHAAEGTRSMQEKSITLGMIAYEEFDGMMAFVARHKLNQPTIVGQSIANAESGDYSVYGTGEPKKEEDMDAVEDGTSGDGGKGSAENNAEDDDSDDSDDESYQPPVDSEDEVPEEYDSNYESDAGSSGSGSEQEESGEEEEEESGAAALAEEFTDISEEELEEEED